MHFVATCRHFVRCNKFFFSVFVNCMGVTCYLADMPGWLGPVFSQASQYITNLSNLHHMLPLNWLVNKGTHGGYLWVFCSPNHQQEHRLLPGFLLVPSRKAVQVAQVHKSNIGLLFNINFNNIYLFD